MGEQYWPERGVAGVSYSTSGPVSVIAGQMGMLPTKTMSSWGHCLGEYVVCAVCSFCHARRWKHQRSHGGPMLPGKVASLGLGTDGVAVTPTVPGKEQRSQVDS